MAWKNLQVEVLEQFADPRWSGMNLQRPAHVTEDANHANADLPDGLASVVENNNYLLTARKADDDFTRRVFEAAPHRLSWTVHQLAIAAGDGSHSGRLAVGHAMGHLPNWVRVQGQYERQYVNKTAVISWLNQQNTLCIADLSKHAGIGRNIARSWLLEAGWKPGAHRDGKNNRDRTRMWTRGAA